MLRVTQSHAPGGGWHVYPADGPMPTQTTRQDLAVATPVVCPAGGPKRQPERVDQPYHTVLVREDCGVATPILAPQNSDVYGQRPDAPAPTVTTKGHQALVSALLMNNTTHHTGGRVDGLVPTVTTGGQAGLVAPILTHYRHGGGQISRLTEPGHAVTAGGNHAMLVAALMMEYYGNSTSCRRPDGSLGAVTTLDRHGLVCCLIDGQEFVVIDILFRMLRPLELAKAMGFRDDYAWPKTQRDTVRLIGNAVSPPQAKALVASVLPNGRRGEQGERRAAS